MTTTKDSSPGKADVADAARQSGMDDSGSQWITSLKARDNWLVGNRRDCPEERRRLANELRARMAEKGITGVRDKEIKFFVEHDTPAIRARIRQKLISAFKDRQATDREYLSLEDVVKAWALLRPESSLTEAKECARDDLVLAVRDGHLPGLLYLLPQAPLECVIDPAGKLIDPVPPDGEVAYLSAASLDFALTTGVTEREDHRIIEMMTQHCWVCREAVVAFLHKRGVDSADMSSAWLKDLLGDDATVVAVDAGKPDSKSVLAAKSIDLKIKNSHKSRAFAESIREVFQGDPPVGTLFQHIKERLEGSSHFRITGLKLDALRDGRYDLTIKRMLGLIDG
jgi:hypothetical protein